ncbi:hypothetical protein IOD16_34125 [Saccharothrix sp. 6-C]|uniref:sunset domain-containing protein n=1 Tax=Saccharothrix sp. 6-C TaxID=2781735 RepID=UPI0019171967|nr:hypothetical protein [Saccharothrix sp. 6-C]QQQ76034.1 hypothetical protein IOD16_34125 [Saccharothrix sp. 6-C]
MSSLFGQVWLWSLLSFVAGVALTWLVLVRPAKRELEDLEERLLTSPRPATGSTSGAAVAPRADAGDEFDNWHVEASRSLADDVLTPDPPPYEPAAAERARFDAPAEPVRYDVTNMKLDQRDSLLEELDDEHRPLSDFEEQHDFPEHEAEPPRSLFERLAPGEDTRETLEPKPRPRPYRSDDEPELPAETTHLMPAVPAAPVAEVAPRQDEPTAPPEVEVFQPREVWREEPVQEVYDEDVDTAGREEEDEPERAPRSTEQTALIPATALAQAIAEVDGEQRRAEEPEPQVWPEHDLTGHFAPVDVESARGELSEPVTRPTPSDEAFLDHLSRNDPRRTDTARNETRHDEARHDDARPTGESEALTEVRPVDPQLLEPRQVEPRQAEPHQVESHQVEPATRPADEVHEEEGPHTDVIRAVVDPAPVEPKPEVAEPQPEPEPVVAQAATPEPDAEPEAAEPPAFEPTFVPQPAEQPLPARSADKAAAPKVEPKKDEPARPRSLFEPLEDDGEPEPERPRPAAASSGNDQPFVPTLSPELLAGNPLPMNPTGTGLPQRPTRPAGAPRTPSPAPLAPKPITPPPPRPVRPRPVGFSPSTGGRQPAPASSRFQGQQEGFNPRSPFGPGSVLPKSDGLAPAPEFQVKATLTGRRYFTDESANFRETRADVWFRTTSDAEKAGFRQAP